LLKGLCALLHTVRHTLDAVLHSLRSLLGCVLHILLSGLLHSLPDTQVLLGLRRSGLSLRLSGGLTRLGGGLSLRRLSLRLGLCDRGGWDGGQGGGEYGSDR
jgi:hypothetical protein